MSEARGTVVHVLGAWTIVGDVRVRRCTHCGAPVVIGFPGAGGQDWHREGDHLRVDRAGKLERTLAAATCVREARL